MSSVLGKMTSWRRSFPCLGYMSKKRMFWNFLRTIRAMRSSKNGNLKGLWELETDLFWLQPKLLGSRRVFAPFSNAQRFPSWLCQIWWRDYIIRDHCAIYIRLGEPSLTHLEEAVESCFQAFLMIQLTDLRSQRNVTTIFQRKELSREDKKTSFHVFSQFISSEPQKLKRISPWLYYAEGFVSDKSLCGIHRW